MIPRSVLVSVLASLAFCARAAAQDSLPIARVLEAARRKDNELDRFRNEAANRDAATQANLARIDARLRSTSTELERSTAAVTQTQTRQQRLDALASAGPGLMDRVRSTEERLIAATRAQNLRAADRVVMIDRGLDALRLKAHALHSTAVSFSAGFDLASVASPSSFSAFAVSIETLRTSTPERSRPMLDLVTQLVSATTAGVPVVSSLVGAMANAFASQADNHKADDLKRASERLLCIGTVSQAALDRLGSVRQASERLQRLSAEVDRRAGAGASALRGSVGFESGETFDTYMRRTYGDLAADAARRDLPYNKLEDALLSVAAAARLEYDLSRSSDDLGTQLLDALREPASMPACTPEVKELSARYERLRPALRELQESLAALAVADAGIAVFVPPLPGR